MDLGLYERLFKDYPALNSEEQRQIAKKARKGNKEARDILVYSNLGLVVKFAKRYNKAEEDFLDAMNAGTIGLIRAVEKYDEGRGNRFSTYACFWIRQAINRQFHNTGKMIKFSSENKMLAREIDKIRLDYFSEKGYYPDIELVRERLNEAFGENIKLKRVAAIAGFNMVEPVSLESKFTGEGFSKLSDALQDKHYKDSVDRLCVLEIIDKLMGKLDEKEQTIIKMRYGLGNWKRKTLNQVGMEFRLTKERIRQIEVKALQKLRRFVNRNGNGICY